MDYALPPFGRPTSWETLLPCKAFHVFCISKGFIYAWKISFQCSHSTWQQAEAIPTPPRTGHVTQNTWKWDLLQCFTLTKGLLPLHSSKPKPAQHIQFKTKWPPQSDVVLVTQKQQPAPLDMLMLCSQNTACCYAIEHLQQTGSTLFVCCSSAAPNGNGQHWTLQLLGQN